MESEKQPDGSEAKWIHIEVRFSLALAMTAACMAKLQTPAPEGATTRFENHASCGLFISCWYCDMYNAAFKFRIVTVSGIVLAPTAKQLVRSDLPAFRHLDQWLIYIEDYRSKLPCQPGTSIPSFGDELTVCLTDASANTARRGDERELSCLAPLT